MTEYVTNIPVEKLKPFPNHPFQVRDDDFMRETVESIKTYGVLQPAIVRPTKDGDYEILSGHRRKHACELKESRTRDIIDESSEESGRQIQRYIRLTELQPELQQMVDDKKMAFTPAVEISYLKPDEQRMLLDTISSEQATPSLSQAQRLKKLSQAGELTDDSMLSIMSEQKKSERNDLTIPADVLEKFFPRSFTPMKMQEVIIKLLESWQRKRQQSRER